MIGLVSYATPRFFASQDKLEQSALRYGADRVFAYREEDLLASSFYRDNQSILLQPRGAGYWIWKPYYILQAMSAMKPGDTIIYSDAGIEITGPLDPLIRLCREQGIVLFQTHNQLNRMWTKRDCFVLMDCDSSRYWDAQQLMGSFSLYLNNDRSRKFVQQWLDYCCNEQIVTDRPNRCGLPNLPEFQDHRHDQSVLSLLAVKHKIEIFRSPSQQGNRYKMKSFRHPGECRKYTSKPYRNSRYDTLLNHHRAK
ncbi:hypothetical protein [Paenibacillus oceani]|uniref:Uncharacterized protein n=1 Tax=Paenibacillus oceani TaxID=2772510 RepID=A0A927CDG7_9BACL|nr:hypothetical protein [Paenibacillus oceani]MBD2865605.1 hypothetical protein [Paenibacillus oceani]